MGTVVTCRIGQESVLLDLDSTESQGATRNHELWRAETYATKEPDTIAWIDEFFREGDVVYDVGANIGQYSLYAARRLHGQCAVHAFEPEALNYAKLNRNIVLNGLTGVIVPYCLAISDETRLDTFYVQSFAPGAALHTFGRPVTQGERPFEAQNQQGTMAVSIDDLTGRFGMPFPNHVKVDVDGLEEKVVAGAETALDDDRLRSVLIEVFMYEEVAARITDVFCRHGFVLHNATDVDYTEGIVQNLIFTRETSAR